MIFDTSLHRLQERFSIPVFVGVRILGSGSVTDCFIRV